jgi:transcriptional regulator with XRE-family HTH domain
MNSKEDFFTLMIVATLKNLRSELGFSQDAVSNATGIAVATLEREKENLSVEDLAELCTFYKISLSDFFKKVEQNMEN